MLQLSTCLDTAVSILEHTDTVGLQASPAAALGLFDLEEFSFGAPPASYRDSTPGLLMDQSLAAPTTMQDVEVRHTQPLHVSTF